MANTDGETREAALPSGERQGRASGKDAAPFRILGDATPLPPLPEVLRTEEVSRLSRDLESIKSERDAAKAAEQKTLRDAAAERDRLQKQVDVANEKRTEAEADLAQANRQIATLQTELAEAPRGGSASQDAVALQERVRNLEEEKSELKEHNRHLEDQVREQNREGRALKRENASLKAALAGTSASAAPGDDPDDVHIGNVEDAVSRASLFERLRFLKGACSRGANLYERPRDIYDAFVALDELARQRADGGIGGRVEDWLKARGIKYAPKESQTTRSERWFFDEVIQEKALFEEHLKFGMGQDPRYCQRIQMAWDADAGEWVIAYVGEHLDNTKTS